VIQLHLAGVFTLCCPDVGNVRIVCTYVVRMYVCASVDPGICRRL